MPGRGPRRRQPELFGSVYAPSTLGEFLRASTHGHVRQLQAVSREFLVQLARRTPLLPGAGGVTFIDVNSILRRVYGKEKQGAGSGPRQGLRVQGAAAATRWWPRLARPMQRR